MFQQGTEIALAHWLHQWETTTQNVHPEHCQSHVFQVNINRPEFVSSLRGAKAVSLIVNKPYKTQNVQLRFFTTHPSTPVEVRILICDQTYTSRPGSCQQHETSTLHLHKNRTSCLTTTINEKMRV